MSAPVTGFPSFWAIECNTVPLLADGQTPNLADFEVYVGGVPATVNAIFIAGNVLYVSTLDNDPPDRLVYTGVAMPLLGVNGLPLVPFDVAVPYP